MIPSDCRVLSLLMLPVTLAIDDTVGLCRGGCWAPTSAPRHCYLGLLSKTRVFSSSRTGAILQPSVCVSRERGSASPCNLDSSWCPSRSRDALPDTGQNPCPFTTPRSLQFSCWQHRSPSSLNVQFSACYRTAWNDSVAPTMLSCVQQRTEGSLLLLLFSYESVQCFEILRTNLKVSLRLQHSVALYLFNLCNYSHMSTMINTCTFLYTFLKYVDTVLDHSLTSSLVSSSFMQLPLVFCFE